MSHCPSCGYTEEDAKLHGDHRLCKNDGNAPWQKKHDRRAMTKPTAPSTPAPQGEIPERHKAIFNECADRVFPDIKGEAVGQIILELGEAESTLARERESRKQAEAALHRLLNAHRCDHRYIRGWLDDKTPWCDECKPARDALAIPQEPAERERGK